VSNIHGIGIVTFGLVVLFIFSSKEYWLLGFSLFLSGLGICLREMATFPIIAIASTIYTTFFIIQQYIPIIHYLISQNCVKFSHTIGLFIGKSIAFGSYASGFWVVMVFFCLILSLFILSDNRSKHIMLFFKSLIGLLLCFVTYLFVVAYFITRGEIIINSLYVLFILCLIPFFYYAHRIKLTPFIRSFSLSRNITVIFILFISITLIVVFAYLAPPGTAKGNVIIYERNCAIDYDLIRFPEGNETIEPLGSYPSAGGLIFILEKLGYNLIHFRGQTNQSLSESLNNASIFIVANLAEPFNDEELKVIWNFVSRGGNILLFADHTSAFVNDTEFQRGRDYFNDILEPTGIRINPDTADWMTASKSWIRGSWAYPLDILPHPLTYGVDIEELSSGSVGASLSITGTARPIISAPWGFSDKANPSNEGHLGNRRYDGGEQIGDIVTVAEDRYGKGKFFVFGDTSYILETELPFEPTLIRNLFRRLIYESTTNNIIFVLLALIVFGLVALVSLVYLMNLKEITLVAFCPFIILLSMASADFTNDLLISETTMVEDIAWIDTSHYNLISLKGSQDDGIDGLFINLLRNGYIPLVMDDLSELSNSNVLIIIAPTKKYTSTEANIIKNFVHDGGILILSAGYGESKSVSPILDIFNIRIMNAPLGSYPWIIKYHTGENLSQKDLENYWHKPKFIEAYPILCNGSYIPYSSVFNEGKRYDLIVGKIYGKGAVLVIGDSRFLLNENLERLSHLTATTPPYKIQWVGNIELLHDVFGDLKVRGVSV
jgi:hypothetical protein